MCQEGCWDSKSNRSHILNEGEPKKRQEKEIIEMKYLNVQIRFVLVARFVETVWAKTRDIHVSYVEVGVKILEE